MGGKVAILGGFAVAVGLIAFLAMRKTEPTAGGDEVGKKAEEGATTATPPPRAATTVDLVYSTEKEAWLKSVLADFAKAHPEIKVELRGKGSFDAARDILDEREKPVLWSPADTAALNVLASDWRQKTGKPLFPEDGDAAPQALLLTPVVFVAWQDRADVLAGGGPITWKRIDELVSSNKGWPAVGGKAEWGFVKLGQTDPTRSNSGLQALVLMAYAWFEKPSLEVGNVLDPAFQEFVKRIQKGVPAFGASTGTLMKDMILYGPSKYDLVLTYENLAIDQLANAQGRWGSLRVYYPERTMWSSHPMALLDAPWVTPEQKAAAEKVVAWLHGKEAQQAALRFGFRPADPGIPIITQDAANPFNAAQAHGIKIELPPVVEAPPGPVVRNLMEMWSRTIKR